MIGKKITVSSFITNTHRMRKMRRLLFTSIRRRQSTQSPQSKRTMNLTLSVSDPEIVSILSKYPEGEERDRFANEALRVGVRIFLFRIHTHIYSFESKVILDIRLYSIITNPHTHSS